MESTIRCHVAVVVPITQRRPVAVPGGKMLPVPLERNPTKTRW